MISYRAFYVWRRNFTVYSTYYQASLVGNIGEPLLYLFAMGFGLGGYIKDINGMSYIDFIAPGLIVTSAMYSATFENTFGSFTRLTGQRTFDSILATPVSLPDLVFGEILWGMTKSIISGTIMLLIMGLFGIYHPSAGILAILPLIALTGYVFASGALCCTALSPSYEFFHYYFVLFIAPMFFLSGVFFPLDRFPAAVQWFALGLPATYSVSLIRYFFHGTNGAPIIVGLIFLLSLGATFTWAAIRLTKKRLVV
jgi:lipooligosaccharide transport system permease protein